MRLKPRVRFAPSPTGIPHIGNTRTALFNWLFARHHQGRFIVRIEDTDRKRLVPESQVKIMEILDAIGLKEDESYRVGGDYGPYVQSRRLDLYQKYAKQLIDKGKAYYCFCPPERLARVRKEKQKQGLVPKYDRYCLALSPEDISNKLKRGDKYVIRLKVPDNKDIAWDDLIQGHITINSANLDDQILLKSDGYPTYHLAVVVDDYLMKISHVLRGAEWISSTPKHILLYQAFGWPIPKFGHFPLILGPDKAKLSKRHGAKSVLDYIDQGYLPEALVNFMVYLGWNYQDNSAVLSLDQLVKLFGLDKIGRSNPVFDINKLNYFNKEHIKRSSLKSLIERLEPHLPTNYPARDRLAQLARLCQPRITRLTDFLSLTEFVYPDKEPEAKLIKKYLTRAEVVRGLRLIRDGLADLTNWNHKVIETLITGIVTDHNLPKGKLYMALRVAVLIKPVTPPLFESLALIDKKLVLNRLDKALKVGRYEKK